MNVVKLLPLDIPNDTKLLLPSVPGPVQMVVLFALTVQTPALVRTIFPGVPVWISKAASVEEELKTCTVERLQVEGSHASWTKASPAL